MYPYLLQLKGNGYNETSKSIPKTIEKASSSNLEVSKTISTYQDFIFPPKIKPNFNQDLIFPPKIKPNFNQDQPLMNLGIVQSNIFENNYMSNYIDSLRANSVIQQARRPENILIDNFITNQMTPSYQNQLKYLPFNRIADPQNLSAYSNNIFQNQRLLNQNNERNNQSVMLKNSLDFMQKQILISNLEAIENLWFRILNSNLKVFHQNNNIN